MDQQPDKLFRDKLNGYQMPVPGGAWNRVSENLRQQRKKYPWLGIAAAVLLLGVAAILLLPSRKDNPAATLSHPARPSAEAMNAPPTGQKEPALAEKTVPGNQVQSRSKSGASPGRQKRKLQTKAMESPLERQVRAGPDNDVANSTPNVPSPEAAEQRVPADQQALAIEKPSSRRVTIVFSAEEVNNKYLDKKAMTDATPEAPSASSLRKLLDKAYALKHNQDPLGELRQKKNEILAFNFKDEKPRHD